MVKTCAARSPHKKTPALSRKGGTGGFIQITLLLFLYFIRLYSSATTKAFAKFLA